MRAGNGLHADDQMGEEARGVDALVVDEAVAVLTLEIGRLAGHAARTRFHQPGDLLPRAPAGVAVSRKEGLPLGDDLR